MSVDLLGQLLKGLAGQGTGGRPAGQAGSGGQVLESILDMLGGGAQCGPAVSRGSGGGLANLIQGFDKEGLGELMSSWIGTGENKAVTPEQVGRGLGPARVQEVAQRSGLSMESLLPVLAAALPMVIDALTPKGQVPDQASLQQGLQALRSRLG
jgi:uncharacterized protein YidB (DUF937 family)